MTTMEKCGFLVHNATGAARKAGIVAGDRVLAVNGEPLLDFIDYNYFSAQAQLNVRVQDAQGIHEVTIRKNPALPLGLDFGDALYPREQVCRNKCLFCFVDQLPKDARAGMRLKDDDWRYSVLFGNFVTLSNVSKAEFARILRRKASPLHVSVHATDPALRATLLGNPTAGDILTPLRALCEAGITVHTQAVLVPTLNTADALQRTMAELYALGEHIRTFAAVPVGLTPHRAGLAALRPFHMQEARDTIAQVEAFAQKALRERGTRFVYASDELYYLAQLPYPRYEQEDYLPQLGNGVGMYWDFVRESNEAARALLCAEAPPLQLLNVTGQAAGSIMREMAASAQAVARNLTVQVAEAHNETFGATVTVAGLLGGQDILREARKHHGYAGVLIPADALRGDVFADDMTLPQLQAALGVPVRACTNDCYDYMNCLVQFWEEFSE